MRRDRAADSREARAASGSTRWRSSSARRTATSACSSMRCAAPGFPAWFDRGTRRPHPAGRAFLALLACAADASRRPLRRIPVARRRCPRKDGTPRRWVTPRRRGHLARTTSVTDDELESEGVAGPAGARYARVGGRRRHAARAVAMGEAARRGRVIGGGAARWRRRLDGIAASSNGGRSMPARRKAPRAATARRVCESEHAASSSSTSSSSRCRSSRRWRLARGGDVGRVARSLRALAPRVLRRPAVRAARARRSAADGGRRADRSRRSAPRARRRGC